MICCEFILILNIGMFMVHEVLLKMDQIQINDEFDGVALQLQFGLYGPPTNFQKTHFMDLQKIKPLSFMVDLRINLSVSSKGSE